MTTDANKNSNTDINILLLGETGVGKSTFINGFFNYLLYNDLAEGLNNDIQVLIPTSFSVADTDTYKSTTITVGTPNKNELCEDNGQSQTQSCKSYSFAIGNRIIRLIDTPGMGDCRGVLQDDENFGNILASISHYTHLNGICILLKPNEHRLNILFRYAVTELLRHIHKDAIKNIMFVFTNARSNFFIPGATARQLKLLLDNLPSHERNEAIFVKENTFLFDNEGFRYLAVKKSGYNYFDDHETVFNESWNRSVIQLRLLIERILKCKPHPVHDMRTLNEAQQLIRKLMRPIGEIARFIEENIKLASDHRQKIEENNKSASFNRIPQKTFRTISLDHPRTICNSTKCSERVKINDDMKIAYNNPCHDRCHLHGVEQEVVNNPIMKRCRAINKDTGQCKRCKCNWSTHMHVTYVVEKDITYIEVEEDKLTKNFDTILLHIDERVALLENEREIVRQVIANLSLFINYNSITAVNYNVIDYINHFIREEEEKRLSGIDNQQIIDNLKDMVERHEKEVKQYKMQNNDSTKNLPIPSVDEIFFYKQQLYELPICGKYISDQVTSLNKSQLNMINQNDQLIHLPSHLYESQVMKDLIQMFN